MMDDTSVPQSQEIALPNVSHKRRKSSKQEAAGKLKAKAKTISGRKPSKLAEKQDSKRHQALEREFSKAQARAESEQAESSAFDFPLGSSTSVQGVWSQ